MRRSFGNVFFGLTCLAALTGAQGIIPSNFNGTGNGNSTGQNTTQLGLVISGNGIPRNSSLNGIMMISQLTNTAGGFDTNRGLQGLFRLVNSGNSGSLSNREIAFLSCDSEDYSGNQGPSDLLQDVVGKDTIATIFYSTRNNSCVFSKSEDQPSDYPYIFTMVHVADARNLTEYWNNEGDEARLTAKALINTVRELLNGQQNQNGNNSNQNGGPSTAVAMIILYSITGVITALFLIIIVTGAIRAHRHPERYGPRAVLGRGRARQSRAKGLARAMLESIPIVKFGEQDNEQAKRGDVELVAGPSTPEPSRDAAAQSASRKSMEPHQRAVPAAGDQEVAPARKSIESGIGSEVATAPAKIATDTDEALGCSICTEDFERGEDVRVLPCDHKFHPPCIDPWLLNVSGTCPLCRIDLRPPTAEPAGGSDAAIGEQTEGNTATSAAGGVTTAQRQSRRFSQMILDPLNRRRMEAATPEERVQALRQYRLRDRANGNEGSAEGRRRRMSLRVSTLLNRTNTASEASPADQTVQSAGTLQGAESPSTSHATTDRR